MKRSVFIFLLAITSMGASAQKDKAKIEAAIIRFFNGLSLINADTLRHYVTPDFQLLEDGQVWTIDTLINKIAPRKGMNITRINRFGFMRTEQKGKMAWVSYANAADFRQDAKAQTKEWLESAVLVKQKGRWRLQLLHSTKIK
jgi:hypothetical protein